LKDEIRFRDKILLSVRDIVSLAPKIGLVKKPMYHKYGVTFVVVVKDEERWIKACLQSIQDVADEIIVVDSSVEDNTTEIVESLAAVNKKIRHIRFYYNGSNAIVLAHHIGLTCANYKWIFKWDSDDVAKSPQALQEWISRLKQLDPNRYYAIDISRIHMKGDLEHQYRPRPFGRYEFRLFTWSPELRWGIVNTNEHVIGDSIWGQRFPPWFKIIRWHEPYVFHCDIKSPKRSVVRRYWEDYMIYKGSQFTSLEEYATYRIREEYGISLEEAIKKNMEQMAKELIPYDKTHYGELPEQIKRSQTTA
jgi:glycosyltransferase involved in cell wall biosynthesis